MQSIWSKDIKKWNFPMINQDYKTPILIVGGGLAGLLCAYELQKRKIKFILVDAKKLTHGATFGTTAQISIAHGELYNKIAKSHGIEKAREYLNNQIIGLNHLKKIVKSENIDCDFHEESTIIGTTSKKLKALNDSYGIINPIFKLSILNNNLSLNMTKGLEFPNQAIINPIKYLNGIINILKKNHAAIYENSSVTKIKKRNNGYEVIINNRHKIKANKIIMACHYPFMLQNLYFAKMYQTTSYATAFKTKFKLNANYVSLDPPYYYLRTYNRNTLIIGGADHFTGANSNIRDCYKLLEKKIYEIDRDTVITHRWFAEDGTPINHLPLVGPYSKKHQNIILIAGFGEWGFTNAHAAASRITKLLKESYNPEKLCLIKNCLGYLRMIGHSVNGLVISRLLMKSGELNGLKEGSGKAVRYQGQNILAYRANKKEYYLFKNKCTHMGCTLIWNDVDKVWISRCHGTIYDKYGKVLYGPGIENLKRIN